MPARVGSASTPADTCAWASAMPSRSTVVGSSPARIRAVAETAYAVVAEAISPAAPPPTPSATSMQVGPTNAESWLSDRTSPTWLSPVPAMRSMSPPHDENVRGASHGSGRRPKGQRACRPATMGAMEWLLLGVSVALMVICGVFGAAEYSFVAVDRAAVERAAATGDRRALGVRKALRSL